MFHSFGYIGMHMRRSYLSNIVCWSRKLWLCSWFMASSSHLVVWCFVLHCFPIMQFDCVSSNLFIYTFFKLLYLHTSKSWNGLNLIPPRFLYLHPRVSNRKTGGSAKNKSSVQDQDRKNDQEVVAVRPAAGTQSDIHGSTPSEISSENKKGNM